MSCGNHLNVASYCYNNAYLKYKNLNFYIDMINLLKLHIIKLLDI